MTTARVKGSRMRSKGSLMKLNPLLYRSSNVEILDAEDDEMALRQAARNSRLPGACMTEHECEHFADIARSFGATKKIYLYIRNKIVQLWLGNSTSELTVQRAVDSLSQPYNSDVAFVQRVHSYLNRYGYINFGVYEMSIPANLEDKKPPLKVLVLGAGISGLTAARKLQSMGCDVKIVEARNRVGGRIVTWQQSKGGPAVDLGAMIVTGLRWLI